MRSARYRQVFLRRIFLLATFIAAAGVADAQPPSYQVYHVGPRMVQRGTTVEVSLYGRGLEDAKEVVFYGPGIRCVAMEPPRSMDKSQPDDRLRCRFEIAPDCPLGEHPLRVRTATEITNVQTLHVTPFPTIDEQEQAPHANDTPVTATEVSADHAATGVTIRGEIADGGKDDVDVFRVPVVAGGRLTAEVASMRIADNLQGNIHLDMAVRVLDDQGRELAANDENPLHVHDPILSIRAPHSGHVFVEIRRSMFCKGGSLYCVHLGPFRRPLAAYPPGGPAGQPLRIELLGDPLGDATETIVVPDEPGDFDFFGDAPTPLRLRSSRMPNVLEDPAARETPVPQLPAAINGVLSKEDERDRFRLTVKQDERLKIRVFSAGLGLAVDPAITLRPVAADGSLGPVEVSADDADLGQHDIYGVASRSGNGPPDKLDPAIVWTPKNTGDYILDIRDVDGNGGARSIYRIEIEPPHDAVHCQLVSDTHFWHECLRTTGLAVPRGERCTVVLSLPEGPGNTYRGDLEIVAHGLPAGVSLLPSRVPAGQRRWPIQLVAEPSATPSAALVTFEARPTEPGRTLESRSFQTIPFADYAADALHIVRLTRFVVAVTESPPFSIEVESPAVPLVRSGELAIPARIRRKPGFEGPIAFECQWVPAGLGVPPTTLMPPGEELVALRISAEANAPLGPVPFAVIATATKDPGGDALMGKQQIRISSQLFTIRVAEPFVAASSPPTSVRRGGRTTYVWNVEQKEPFEGEATVRLLGLPKGLSVREPLPTITKASKEVSFELEASRDSLVGLVRNVACELTVTTGGQTIRQQTGDGTLRVDPELAAVGEKQ